jgi:hypothetical protein
LHLYIEKGDGSVSCVVMEMWWRGELKRKTVNRIVYVLF